MKSVLKVVGKPYSKYNEAIKEVKRFDDHSDYLFGYILDRKENDSTTYIPVVYLEYDKAKPLPEIDGIEQLNCIYGVKLRR